LLARTVISAHFHAGR